MIKILLTSIILLLSAKFIAQKETSVEATNYLKEFISVVKANAMQKDSIDWIQFEQRVFQKAKGSQSIKDTYEALKMGIELLNDGHSFLMTPEETEEWKKGIKEDTVVSIPGPIPYGELVEKIGYINLPWFHSGNDNSCQLFADTLQSFWSISRISISILSIKSFFC